MRSRLRVLVLTTEYRAGPWALRSLRRAGHTVVPADGEGNGGRSRACLSPRRFPRPTRDPGAFAAWVSAVCREEGIDVVFPVSEDVVRALAETEPDLAGARLAGPTRAQYAALCDKAVLGEVAARAGVAHPVTRVVAPGDDPAGAWPPLPSVVKPRTSGESVACDPVRVVRTPDARAEAVAALHAAGIDAIVQEVVTGRRWSLHGVRFPDGTLLTVGLEVVDTFPRDAGTSSVLRTGEPPAGLVEACRRLTAAVAYVGPVSLNVIERAGAYVVHDVNLRLSSSIGASIRAGLDVPALGAAAAAGLAAPGPAPVAPRTYIRWEGETAAIRAARRAPGGDRSPARLTARLVRGLLHPRTVLDPSPFDPVLVTRRLVLRGRGLLRGVRATVRGRVA